MIKPPFTVLILKNSHHPMTIRVSIFFFLLIFVIIPIMIALAGFGLSLAWKGYADRSSVLLSSHRSISPDQLTVNPVVVSPGTQASANAPEITDLFISRLKNGRMEITFSLMNISSGENTYIWVMTNPDDVSTGEMAIVPRSPIFRGFPVDYRNGILFDRSAGKPCEITLSDEIAGIMVKKIRILVYSMAGKLLADKEFSINQN
jgi:hypothetical protein